MITGWRDGLTRARAVRFEIHSRRECASGPGQNGDSQFFVGVELVDGVPDALGDGKVDGVFASGLLIVVTSMALRPSVMTRCSRKPPPHQCRPSGY
jgi:hypothetical protein